MTTATRTPDAALRNVGTTTRAMVARILRTFDRATPSDIEAGATWYADAYALALELAPRCGSLEHAAAVIAHLSPRTPWSRNVAAAVSLAHGGDAPGAMRANVNRARAALAASDPLATLKGPKTAAFARNIAGDHDAVTVDVWAWRVAMGPDADDTALARVGVYSATARAYRIAAARRGVTPATMQATTWVVARGGRAH